MDPPQYTCLRTWAFSCLFSHTFQNTYSLQYNHNYFQHSLHGDYSWMRPSEHINNAIIIIIHRVSLEQHTIHRNIDSPEHCQYMYMCSTDTFHRISSKDLSNVPDYSLWEFFFALRLLVQVRMCFFFYQKALLLDHEDLPISFSKN